MAVDNYVQKKLKALRIKNNYTLEQLATMLETTPITLSRYETGKRSVSLCVLEEICKIYNLSVTDFFSDNPLLEDGKLLNTGAPVPTTKTDNIIQVYGQIAAGYFNTATQDCLDEIEIPHTLLKRFGKDNLFGLAVNGESMNKIVQNNDYVILNRQSTANNGDVVAVLLNNEDATLKRFFQLDSETIILKPESNSPKFQPITIDLRQNDVELTILGKAIWYCAPYYNNL